MNQNLEFEDEGLNPDSVEDNHPRTNYGAGYSTESDWNYKKEQTIFKWNNSRLALLCSTCDKIIKEGKDFNLGEMRACHGKATLNPQYCEKCKNKKL